MHSLRQPGPARPTSFAKLLLARPASSSLRTPAGAHRAAHAAVDRTSVPIVLPSERFRHADDTTRTGHDASRHALHIVEYALSAPAPRRERTWLHRLQVAVDALADAIDSQIRNNDDSIGLLAEIALSEPAYIDSVLDIRNEQRTLRIEIASLREQLDDRPELPIDTNNLRNRFAELARRYRQHQTRETELIHTALNIDITKPSQ